MAMYKTTNPNYQRNMRTPPNSSYYEKLKLPDFQAIAEARAHNVHVGHVIGVNGKVFKAITHQSGATYIWFDGEYVEVWADNENAVKDALKRVERRCQLVMRQASNRLSCIRVGNVLHGTAEEEQT